jgi:hypothetical protein
MANLKAYIDAPLFYDDTELSASLLNIIRNNSEAIKNAVLIPQPAFDIHRALNVQSGKDTWKGGFQYRTGLTTAVFIIYSKQVTGQGATDMVIYFNDIEVDRYSSAIGGINVGGYSGRVITISGLGYTDFQIITVRVSPEGTSAEKGVQFVQDAYVGPLSNVNIGSWPGNPSFGSIDATKLNQLANASDYLANRLSLVPMPLSMGYIQWMGTNNPKYPDFRYFTARATNGNNRLKTNIYYQCRQTSASIALDIGGVVTTQGPYSYGQNVLVQFDVDMIAAGLSWNVDYFSKISEITHIQSPDIDGNGGHIFSRIDNGPIRIGANSYSVSAVRPENLMRESLTYATVQTRLNNISNDIAVSYSTINANPRVFDRATMVRSRYGVNQEQNDYWQNVFVPSIYRQGDVLWVKGQGLKIAYGSVTQKPKSDAKPNDVWEYEFQFTHDLLDGDKITQQYFYLDQFEALYPGMRYFIIGKDVIYAAEHLR